MIWYGCVVKLLNPSEISEPSEHCGTGIPRPTKLKNASVKIAVGISDSVQTLSAISEELTAHAHETLEAENKNTDILDTIASKMQELVIFTQNQF